MTETTTTTDKSGHLATAKREKAKADLARTKYEAAAVDAYVAGATMAEVANALGFSQAAVAKLLDRHHVAPRPRGRATTGRYASGDS